MFWFMVLAAIDGTEPAVASETTQWMSTDAIASLVKFFPATFKKAFFDKTRSFSLGLCEVPPRHSLNLYIFKLNFCYPH